MMIASDTVRLNDSLGKTIQVIAFLSAIMGFSGERSTDHNRKVRWSNEQIASGRMKKGIHLDNPRPNEQWPTALIIAPSSVCEKCGARSNDALPTMLADGLPLGAS